MLCREPVMYKVWDEKGNRREIVDATFVSLVNTAKNTGEN